MFKNDRYYAFFCALIIAVSLIWAFMPRKSTSVSADAHAARTIVIDAGHGGVDGGAVSADGVCESDINLAIALKLSDLSMLCGDRCVLTRSDENSLHSDDAQTIRQKKVSDMQNRVALIENVDNALLVSIHQNSFEGPSRGAQVFYRDGDALSRQIATLAQDNLRLAHGYDSNRAAAPIPQSVYLFKNTTCTAVLVECGFLSDKDDALLLQTEEHRIKTALGVMSAVLMSDDFKEYQ